MSEAPAVTYDKYRVSAEGKNGIVRGTSGLLCPCEIIATESQLLFLFHKIKYLARSKYQYLECYFFFIKEHMESQIIAELSPPPPHPLFLAHFRAL